MRSICLILTVAAIAASVTLSGQRREEIRDPSNRLLGTIVDRSDGVLEARDPQNRIVGTYRHADNRTRRPDNRVVSTGNTLSALLLCPESLRASHSACDEESVFRCRFKDRPKPPRV